MKPNKLWGVKISSTFVHRARCPKCGGRPAYSVYNYFCVRNLTGWVSLKQNTDILKWIKTYNRRLCDDYYLFGKPSYTKSVNEFSHAVNYKGSKTRLHRNKGITPGNDFIDFISCSCGKSIWAYYTRSSQSRAEVENRTGKYYYKND